MSCGWTSLLTNVTCMPTAIVISTGVTPLDVIVIVSSTGAGAGVTGAVGAGEGAVGPGAEVELHAVVIAIVTPTETHFANSNRAELRMVVSGTNIMIDEEGQ